MLRENAVALLFSSSLNQNYHIFFQQTPNSIRLGTNKKIQTLERENLLRLVHYHSK
jgi:hypothetical protein